jgi:hypothetical protein
MAAKLFWQVVIAERGKLIETVIGESESEAEVKAHSRVEDLRKLHPAAVSHRPEAHKTQTRRRSPDLADNKATG